MLDDIRQKIRRMAFDGKINKEISLIIYRYAHQRLINELNKEYHESFESITFNNQTLGVRTRVSLTDELYSNIRMPIHFTYYDPEHRVKREYEFGITHLNLKSKTFKIYSIDVDTIRNYGFTSTKSLQELRQNRVKCLIK